MNISEKRCYERRAKAFRVRKKITGTTERPRLCVRRSLKHMYAQIVDDVTGKTLVQVGSNAKEFLEKTSGKKLSKSDVSKIIGEMVAEKANENGVTKVVFDRKGYLFHGRVKALAEAARGKGLSF